MVERVCVVCDKKFKAFFFDVKRGGGKYCSRKCYYKRAKRSKEMKCLTCGKEFFAFPSEIKAGFAKYCSRKCMGIGKMNRVKKICLVCGKEFSVYPAEIKKGGGKYCSRRCWVKGQNGKNHWNWQGGISFEPYGPEFNEELKEQIRKRDNYRCQECFRHQDELFTETGKRYKLIVHHIDYNKTNNKPKNLNSLCRGCHLQTNFSREDWTKYFQQKVSSP